MSLELRYEFTNNANLTSVGSNGVRFGEVALSQAAEVGQPAVSTLDFDDDAAALDIVGWRQFLATESAAASNSQLIGKFRVGARSYSRGPSQRTTVARKMKVDLLDYNSQLGLRLFVDSDANRPAETASDRLTWVLSTRPNTLYAHPTLCSAPATAMDACDYRQQRYNDVLADIANTTGYNFWCAFDEGRQRSEIFFMDPGSSSYASTISISNDLAEIDSSMVFAMSEDTEMRRDPSRITSGALVAYANGSVYENRFSTADNYEFIDQTAPLANVKTAAKARAIAIRYLDDNDEEDDRITTSIIVPAAQVNDVRQGHLIRFVATHLPGYESGRLVRVLRRTVIQEAALGLNYYRIALELSGPGNAPTSCSTAVVSAISTTLDTPEPAASGTMSLAVSPTFSGPTILIPVFSVTAGNPSNSIGAFAGGYSTLQYDNTTQVGVALRVGFQQGTSPATFTAGATWDTLGIGDGGLLAIHAAIPSSASGVVQSNYQTGFGATGLGVAPTTGNLVLMVCHAWGNNIITGPGVSGPATGWTTLGFVTNTSSLPVPPYNGINRASLAVYARCAAPGDGTTYDFGISGGNASAKATYLAEFTV